MSRKSQPENIASLIGGLVNDRNWQSRFELHEVFDFWDEVVGPEIARQAQPIKLRGNTLVVEVADSVWMTQLQYLKITLLTKINDHLGHGRITDLRFKLNYSLKTKESVPEYKTNEVQVEPQPVPSPAECAELTSMLAGVGDPDLQQAIAKCWRSLFGRNQSS